MPAFTFIVPTSAAIATSESDRIVYADALARGTVAHHVHTETKTGRQSWSRKLHGFDTNTTGVIWSSGPESDRVAFTALECISAKRTVAVCEANLPADTDNETAARVLRQVQRILKQRPDGYGVKSDALLSLVKTADVDGLTKVRKISKRKPAETPETPESGAPAETPETPETPETGKPAETPETSTDAPNVSVSVAVIVDPVARIVDELQTLDSVTPAQFDALKAALVALKITESV